MNRNASEFTLVRVTENAEETRSLAERLASFAEPGDVILLTGDLGAGKTHFAQGFAAGLGIDQTVISPTFNIVITYESGRIPLHHFDLYRIESANELEDIGLAEYLDSDGACIVEWPDSYLDLFGDALLMKIEKDGESRRLVFGKPMGKRSETLLSKIMGPCSTGDSAANPTMPNPNREERGACALGRASNTNEGEARRNAHAGASRSYVLAFDTANEVIALGLGLLDSSARSVEFVTQKVVRAHRASNVQLVPLVDALLTEMGVARESIACICVGRGPGSFTGVRIAVATAKGMASALGLPLIGVSTLDAVAWNAWESGVRGNLLVAADAMRKEVYPVLYAVSGSGPKRQTADSVVKASAFEMPHAYADDRESAVAAVLPGYESDQISISGDALFKYRDIFESLGSVLEESTWEVTGRGLLRAFERLWQAGEIDPHDSERHGPELVLPVYTRLSDAEENERARLAQPYDRDLESGVHGRMPDGGKGRATMHARAPLGVRADARGIAYCPLDAHHVSDIAQLESSIMGSDAWNERMVADELGLRDRTWWIAQSCGRLVGYAGGLVVSGELQILKVGVHPDFRHRGIARELICRISDDARNLGADSCTLEVRLSNKGAICFYETFGLTRLCVRPRYYSDGEDALIMSGPIPQLERDVAGMEIKHVGNTETTPSPSGKRAANEPLILAIESSCDETAAAVVNSSGRLLSDVLASQIDFHSRFGGVVPEIASRKHIEAICGVCEAALEDASQAGLAWNDIDAVAVTYAPGLLGALVVGVAFAKGAAWALDVPFIKVNHLEGHLYANKIGTPEFKPPAVVSLVSGGNTMLVHMRDWGDYEVLGGTIDDAVGEAFDKVSKALGLGYPGGPVISRYAKEGNPAAIDFPRPLLHSHDLRFSLSGLKTAVVNYIEGQRSTGNELNIPDIAASFQQSVVDVQIAKTKDALRRTGAPTFCLGGGVAANPALRAAYEDLCEKMGVNLVMPPLSSCGDNAGMIALVALDRYRDGKFSTFDTDALAHANLEEPY